MSSDAAVVVDRPSEGVLRLLLNRPERRNAIDRAVVDALLQSLDQLDCAAVVLGSTGAAAFSSGADISLGDEERAEVSGLLYELYHRMVTFPAPIVAAVSGFAVGGGAQLALASDIRIAGPEAVFRFPGPGHGLAVGAWGLPSLVGRGRAVELCLTMRDVAAEEAYRIGLVDRLEADPLHAAGELAASFTSLAKNTAARVKRIAIEASSLLMALELEQRENRDWNGSLQG